jgi:hypothetical protein
MTARNQEMPVPARPGGEIGCQVDPAPAAMQSFGRAFRS